MTRKWIAAGLLLAAGIVSPAQAGEKWDEFWAGCKRDYHRNKAWPEPFVRADRDSVNAPFQVMAANGWQKYNLLGEPHFESDGKSLSPAGVMKMRRIINEQQPEKRVIYIERANTQADTAQRVAILQKASAGYAQDGQEVPVIVSNMPLEGWQGDQVNSVFTKVKASQPEPRLPAPQADSGSSSGK